MAICISSNGLRRLQNELNEQHARLERLREERATAHELSGDGWHDNPYFNQLQQMEAEKTQHIARLRQTLATARVVDIRDGQRPERVVAYGSIVELLIEDATGEERTEFWEIVGHGESEPAKRRIAYDVPRIRPVMGLEPGDTATIILDEEELVAEVVELHQSMPEGSAIGAQP